MPSTSLLVLTFASVAGSAVAKQITVLNSCVATTRWPGLFGGDTSGVSTGWEAVAGFESVVTVPDTWTSGRIWARTECDFTSGQQDETSCLTGGCAGGLECTAYGKTPATLAEFGLGAYAGSDFYDISLVDGFNVPLSITPVGADGCTAPSCSVDLLVDCPAALQKDFNEHGVAQGCASACAAIGGDANCCTGAHSTADTCPSSSVESAAYFKQGCEQAYSYAYDDKTSLFACGGGDVVVEGYKVEFCPSA